MTAERWRIELLGGLHVRRGDRALSGLQRQQPAVLLAYLAYHCPANRSRDALAQLLWPDSEQWPNNPEAAMEDNPLPEHASRYPTVPDVMRSNLSTNKGWTQDKHGNWGNGLDWEEGISITAYELLGHGRED